ncbi:putative death-receptor fusion protein-domain-containing protein [Scheffersomyces amazonensis]|uniref:putative death-receptor fusion protein-domain-containing protein n=1 Tax=Scheffersomyces amazonensis TaxID=1078765 RepID=UPI00315DEC0A
MEQNHESRTEVLRLNELKSYLINLKVETSSVTELNSHFQSLYTQLLTIGTKGGLDDKTLTLFNDTLSICILRLNQALKTQDFSDLNIEHYNNIFEYILQFIQNSSSPLFNSLQSLLNKLLDLIRVHSNDKYQDILKIWIELLLTRNSIENSSISLQDKNTFIILNIILKKKTSVRYILDQFPEFIDSTLKLLGFDTLANVISKTIVHLFTDLYDPNNQQEWVNTWLPYISQGFKSDNKKIIQSIQTHILPALFKIYPPSLNLLIEHFSHENIDIVIKLLKLGQSLSYIEPESLIEGGILTEYLTHSQPHYRLDTLEILLGGRMSINDPPISTSIFNIIKNHFLIDIFFNDYEEIEVRNRFVSIFGQFLTVRFKNSLSVLKKSSKKSPDDNNVLKSIDSHEQFLSWLENHLLNYLTSTANYSQIITSLKLLEIISFKLPKLTKLYENKVYLHLLVENLFNNYENVRQLSLTLLINKNEIENLKDHFKSLGLENIESINKVYDILKDLSGRKSEGGAKFIEYICQSKLLLFKDEDYIRAITLKLLNDMKINNKINDHNFSLHGFFKALNLVISHWELDFLLRNQDLVKQIHSVVYQLSKDLWDYYVANVVIVEDSTEEVDDDESSLLSSYWWKTIKESNNLLTILFVNVNVSSQITTASNIVNAFELIKDQLEKISHRGTFSSIYPSFISICKACFKDPNYESYSHKWLTESLDLIQSGNSQYISRRSGSIPFVIAGILIGSIDSIHEGEVISSTFNILLNIAKQPYSHKHDEAYDIPQVHGFNCLKQIFQESQLTKACLKYVPVSLELSLTHFASENWSIRNCSVMLFTTIHNRLFGGNINHTSKYSANLLFKKFDGIHTILNTFKDEKTVVLILLLLTNIDFNTPIADYPDGSLEDVEMTIRKWIPTNLSNPSFKIREMAARCIANSFKGTEILELFIEQVNQNNNLNKNSLHGLLLMIFESSHKFVNNDLAKELVAFLYSKISFCLHTKSFEISKVYFDIILQYKPTKMVVNFIGNYFATQCTLNSTRLEGCRGLALSCATKILLRHYLEFNEISNFIDVIELSLLSFDSYDVQITALQFLNDNLIVIGEKHEIIEKLESLIWELIIDGSCWSYVQHYALDVFKNFKVKNTNVNSKIEKLLEIVIENYDESVTLKALECLGNLLPENFNETSVKTYLDICEQNLNEEKPLKFRDSALRSLVLYSSNGLHSIGSSRALGLIALKGLYDEDTDLRLIAGNFISSSLGYTQPQAPTLLTKLDIFKTIQGSGVLTEIILKTLFDMTMSFEDIANLRYHSSSSKIFDIETSNLYKNEIQVIESCLIALKSSANKINYESSFYFSLMQQKLLSDILILQIAAKFDYVTLANDANINKSLLITITMTESWIKIYPNDTLTIELNHLKSQLNKFNYVYIN